MPVLQEARHLFDVHSVDGIYLDGIIPFADGNRFKELSHVEDVSDYIRVIPQGNKLLISFVYAPTSYYGEGIDPNDAGDLPNLGSDDCTMDFVTIFCVPFGSPFSHPLYSDSLKNAEKAFTAVAALNGVIYEVEGHLAADE